jgi:hypothetical protein
MKKLVFSALIAAPLLPAVRADVFTLWPFSSKSAASVDPSEGSLTGKKLWTEPVEINGLAVSLDVSLVETDTDTWLRLLRAAFPSALVWRSPGSVLAEIKNPDGTRKRILLVKADETHPALRFAMDIPDKMPPPSGSSALPAPLAAAPEAVMSFKKRGTVYGAYSWDGGPDEAAAAFERAALADGWKPAGTGKVQNSSGVYLKDRPPSMLTMSFNWDGSGKKSAAALYLKKLK